MRTRWWAGPAVSAAIAVLIGAPAAFAAPARSSGHEPVSVHEARAVDGTITARVSGLDGPADRVILQINGRPVPVTTRTAENSALLVVDTSRSVGGSGLTAVRSAAADYLAAVPAQVPVGLITFARTARLVVRPTLSRSAVTVALGHAQPRNGSAIYDALALATTVSAHSRVLVLTDGSDTASVRDLDAGLAAVTRGGTAVDVVGLGHESDEGDRVEGRIAAGGHGHRYLAQSAGRAADSFRQASISARVPADLVAPWRISVTVSDASGQAVAETTVSPNTPHTRSPAGRIWRMIGLGAVFLSLVLLVLLLIDMPRDARLRHRMRELVGRYSGRARAEREREAQSRFRETSVARTALQLANRVTSRRGIGERINRMLQTARVSLESNEWLLVCVGIAIATGVVVTLVSRNPLIGLVVGLVAGTLVPHAFLTIKANRRQQAFSNDLPDALQLMAGALSSGYSLPQAVDSVVRLGEGPIAEEFGRALAQARLGTTIEDALDEVAERLDNVDFRWVVMAIRIQRQVGGNLSEVLTQVAETIRERAWLQRHVKGLSAEGRLSAYILGGLPIVVGGYMFMVRRSYIAPLYTDALGLVLLGGSVVMLAIGGLAMRKLVKVEL